MSEWAEWVEILWGFTKFSFKQMLKVSLFYLEKQKSFIPKKIFFEPFVNTKTKKLCLLTQFSGKVLEWLTSSKTSSFLDLNSLSSIGTSLVLPFSQQQQKHQEGLQQRTTDAWSRFQIFYGLNLKPETQIEKLHWQNCWLMQYQGTHWQNMCWNWLQK